MIILCKFCIKRDLNSQDMQQLIAKGYALTIGPRPSYRLYYLVSYRLASYQVIVFTVWSIIVCTGQLLAVLVSYCLLSGQLLSVLVSYCLYWSVIV